jgi:hypothetical protein
LGTYSLRLSGKSSSGQPDAAVGILASDGVSKVAGLLTENKHGTVCLFVLSGSYTVNPNGTGAIDLTATPTGAGCTGATRVQSSVLFNMGNGAAFINTGSAVWLGSFTRQ